MISDVELEGMFVSSFFFFLSFDENQRGAVVLVMFKPLLLKSVDCIGSGTNLPGDYQSDHFILLENCQGSSLASSVLAV